KLHADDAAETQLPGHDESAALARPEIDEAELAGVDAGAPHRLAQRLRAAALIHQRPGRSLRGDAHVHDVHGRAGVGAMTAVEALPALVRDVDQPSGVARDEPERAAHPVALDRPPR